MDARRSRKLRAKSSVVLPKGRRLPTSSPRAVHRGQPDETCPSSEGTRPCTKKDGGFARLGIGAAYDGASRAVDRLPTIEGKCHHAEVSAVDDIRGP